MEKRLITNRFFKLAGIAVLVVALACVALVRPALADDSSSAASASAASEASGSAESAAAAAESTTGKTAEADSTPLGGLPMMGNDYVWFGRDLELSDAMIGNDLIAAGQIINIRSCTAPGDFRLAGQSVRVKDSAAFENITAAAESVAIEDTQANAIAAAGNTVSFSGSCEELTIYAEDVLIDGIVYGDVVVGGNTVVLGPNAHIMGTLHASAPSAPVMESGAEVADLDYTHTEADSATSAADVESAMAGLMSALAVFLAVMSIVGTLIVAVLAEWLFRRQTAGAAEMIRTRTGAHIGTGVVGALVAPIAVILLICFGVTLPVAGGVAFALFAMSCVAGGFAGASLFKLAFPKLGRYKCALAGGAIVGVAGAIPILGSIVSAAAFMYLLGYVLQSIFLGMRDPAPVAPAAAPAPFAPAAAVSPVAPVAATAPIVSAVPAEPVAPAGSTAPLASVEPVEPVVPVDPVAPAAPAGSEPPVSAEE